MPSDVRSGAKPSAFKSASSFGADRRPSRDGKKTHLEEALSMPAFSGPNVPVCNVDGVPVKLVTASVCLLIEQMLCSFEVNMKYGCKGFGRFKFWVDGLDSGSTFSV